MRSRSTRIAKTSSNDCRASLADVTSPPLPLIASTTSGSAVDASSTVTRSVRRSAPLDAPDDRQRGEAGAVEVVAELDLDGIPAHRLATQLVGMGQRDEPAVRDQGDGVAFLRLVDVLGGHEERPSVIAQAMELLPDGGSQDRVDPGGGLVEEQQVGIVDEGRGQLQASLHATRQAAGTAAADVPQVHELEDLAGATVTGAPQDAEQRRDEIDVLARRQVGIQRELLRHVADPFAGLPPEGPRVLAEDANLPVGRARAHR